MGVTYEINQAQQRVYTRCAGEVRLAEVLEHFEVLSADPDCPDWLDVMLDLSDMKTLPTSAELNRVSTEIARVLPRVRFRYCAIIATWEALFGMARMFEVFSEKYFTATRVFRTVEEGLTWLDSSAR
jgi:hypothetical protein